MVNRRSNNKHGWIKLSQIKSAYFKFHMERRKKRIRNDWKHYEHIFRDITQGLTINEASRKHKIARTQIYQVLKQLGIGLPPPLTYTHRILTRKIRNYRSIPTDIPLLDNCECRTCQWLRLRLERLKRNDENIRMTVNRMGS